MGTFAIRILNDIVSHVVFWLVGVPVGILFAAYLVGIAVMCTKEAWRIRKNDRKRRSPCEKADPPL